MNKVHNVAAVSPLCFMVRRDNWMDFGPGLAGGPAALDLARRQHAAGRRFAVTPHAKGMLLPQ